MSLVVSCNRAYDIVTFDANHFYFFQTIILTILFFKRSDIINSNDIRKYYIVAETIFETDYVSGL